MERVGGDRKKIRDRSFLYLNWVSLSIKYVEIRRERERVVGGGDIRRREGGDQERVNEKIFLLTPTHRSQQNTRHV